MSETTSTTDSLSSTPSDAPSSSVVDTPGTPAPSAPADSSAPAPSTGTDAQTSPSSGDSRQSDREGLLAAVRSVVDKTPPVSEGDRPEGDTASDPSAGDKDTAPGEQSSRTDDKTSRTTNEDDPNAPDPSESELRKLRPETRKRFERLLRQRNEARQAYAAIEPELRQSRALTAQIQQAQLAPDDFNQALFVASMMKQGRWQEFLEGITPFVMTAQEALGLRIARDLQGQVNDGTLSEDAARELTRTRFRAMQAEAQLKDTSVARTTDNQTRTVQDIRTSVEQWEASIRTRDPDYAHKADTVRRFSQGLMQEKGVPQNPQQAVALVQAAYDDVTRLFTAQRPAPRPTQRTPSSVHVATGGVSAEPSSMKEAALQALARMRRAS